MHPVSLRFPGYSSGKTDFAELISTTNQPDLPALKAAVAEVASWLVNPALRQFASMIVIGCSDRDDTPSKTCDQRRSSESNASKARAESAYDWFMQEIHAACMGHGVNPGDWAPTVSWFTSGTVFAGAAKLKHDPPINEAQRKENRRVVFVYSRFPPAPQ